MKKDVPAGPGRTCMPLSYSGIIHIFNPPQIENAFENLLSLGWRDGSMDCSTMRTSRQVMSRVSHSSSSRGLGIHIHLHRHAPTNR